MESEFEKALDFAKRLGDIRNESAYKDAYNKLTPLEKEKFDLEILNLKLINKNLKHKWWKSPVIWLIGVIVGITTPTLSKYLEIKCFPKEEVKKICKDTVICLTHSNQKDSLKKK